MRALVRNRTGRRRVAGATAIVTLSGLIIGAITQPSQSQDTPQIHVEGGFRYPDYDSEGRLSRLITGERAEPQADRPHILVEDFRMETYRYRPDRETDLVIETPSCFFSQAEASSAETIRMEREDPPFSIRGRGFLWNREESSLVISNEVQTTLRGDDSEDGEQEDRDLSQAGIQSLEIQSDRFRFEFDTGDAQYSGNVAAADGERFRLKAAELNVELRGQTRAFETVTAKGDVEIDLKREGRAFRLQGNQAVYQAGSEASPEVTVSGQSQWETEGVSGAADQLLLNPETEEFRAQGEASLRLRRDIRADEGEEEAAQQSSEPIDIESASYRFRSNEILFEGDVKARQANDWELQCHRMRVALTQDRDAVEGIIAEGEVQMSGASLEGDVQASGDQLHYQEIGQPGERLELTGSPSWRTARYEGRAERLTIRVHKEIFMAETNAQARILPPPSSDQSDSGRGESPDSSLEIRTEPIEIASARYRIEPGKAHFEEGVEVTHPQWELESDTADLTFHPDSSEVEWVEATGSVALRSHDRANAGPQVKPSEENESPDDGDPGRDPLQGLFPAREGSSGDWRLFCDRLSALSEPGDGHFESIEGQGNIQMIQGENQVTGDRLLYHPANRELNLKGSPRLITGNEMQVEGEADTVFIFNTASEQFRAQGNYRITLPESALGRTEPPATPPF